MDEILRKLRGFAGAAAMWGVMWAAIFAAMIVVIGLIDPDSVDPGEGPLAFLTIGATYGAITGIVFAGLLAVAEGRKRLADVSVLRVGLWGALAAAVFPLATPVHDGMLLFLCPIGAALAAGTVAIAKRAELPAGEETPSLPG